MRSTLSFVSSSTFLHIIAVTLHGKSASQLNNLYQLPPLPGSVLYWDHSIMLKGIQNPLIFVHSYTVAWPRALGCLIFFTNERTTEYRRWKGESTAPAAVGEKHDPSKVVFSPLSGTDNPTMQRKGSAAGKGMVPPHRDTIVFSLAHGHSRKKVSSAALAECIGVWFHFLGACVSACVQKTTGRST